MNDLPLFAWQPPPKLIVFPLTARIGKVRHMAVKMPATTTDRHAEYYRKQVTEALLQQLDRFGIPEAEQDEQLGAFWCEVRGEVGRQSYARMHSSDPGGAA